MGKKKISKKQAKKAKKKIKKKTAKVKAGKFRIRKGPKFFSAFLESKPHVALSAATSPCRSMEKAADERLTTDCARKQFTVDDIAAPCEFDIDLAPGDLHVGGCGPVDLPFVRPCFKLRWGDGPSDHIETDDVEVLCLTAWNPHSNVTLKDVTAYIYVADESGDPPEILPDGTSSVEITPDAMICFDDIGPCDESGNSEDPVVSREVVLLSRGAKAGKYHVFVLYCYTVEFSSVFASVFPIDLVAS